MRAGSRSKSKRAIENDGSGGVKNSYASAPAISVALTAFGVLVGDVPSFHWRHPGCGDSRIPGLSGVQRTSR